MSNGVEDTFLLRVWAFGSLANLIRCAVSVSFFSKVLGLVFSTAEHKSGSPSLSPLGAAGVFSLEGTLFAGGQPKKVDVGPNKPHHPSPRSRFFSWDQTKPRRCSWCARSSRCSSPTTGTPTTSRIPRTTGRRPCAERSARTGGRARRRGVSTRKAEGGGGGEF